MSNKLEISLLGKLRREPLVNAALNIIPTFTGWDVDPTNPENATDGNPTTVTGTGSKTVAGTGAFGNFKLILPSYSTYLITLKVGLWSTTGSHRIYINTNADGVNFTSTSFAITNVTQTTEYVHNTLSFVGSFDTILFPFNPTGAGTYYLKIYEINAFKLK